VTFDFQNNFKLNYNKTEIKMFPNIFKININITIIQIRKEFLFLFKNTFQSTNTNNNYTTNNSSM